MRGGIWSAWWLVVEERFQGLNVRCLCLQDKECDGSVCGSSARERDAIAMLQRLRGTFTAKGMLMVKSEEMYGVELRREEKDKDKERAFCFSCTLRLISGHYPGEVKSGLGLIAIIIGSVLL